MNTFNENAVSKINNAAAAVQNSANSAHFSKLAERAAAEKTTEKVCNILVRYAEALAQSDIAVDVNIVSRNAYAIEKVTKLLRALRAKSASFVDHYTLAIVHNAKLRKNRTLDCKQQNATLSASIELDTMRVKDQRLHKATSTASTQRSSSAYALAAIDAAVYDKRAHTVTLNDNDVTRALFDLK